MIAYLTSVLLFFLNFFFSRYMRRKINILKKSNRKIKEEMVSYISEKEKEHQFENIKLFRLRILELFTKLKDEEEKEEIRSELKGIVKRNGGRPQRVLALELLILSFTVLCIYVLLFLFSSSSTFYLAIFVNILVIFFWIARKRYFFSLIFGLVGIIFYFKMPGHLLFFIGLNMMVLVLGKNKEKANIQKDEDDATMRK